MSRETLLPPPHILGLPTKFGDWRNLQDGAVATCLDSKRRFILECAPTGFGKSAVYMAQAALTSGRTVVLTSTKGLQAQLLADFKEMGLQSIKGMNAYPCRAAPDFGFHNLDCEAGPCHGGLRCNLKDAGCDYYDAYRVACRAKLVVTNYSYWMAVNQYGEGLGEFDLMILDEAHDAPDHLVDFVSVEVTGWDMKVLRGGGRPRKGDWARARAEELEGDIMDQSLRLQTGGVEMGTVLRQIRQMKRTQQKMRRLASAGEEWVEEETEDGWKWSPVWGGKYREVLFRDIKKIVLYSATIMPKTAELVGVGEGEMEYHSYPSTFSIENRRLHHIKCIQVNRYTTPDEFRWAVNKLDEIIEGRLDRKGIVHTVSYVRARQVVERSKYKDLMILPDRRSTADDVQRFRESWPPRILVSPSVGTGWDFPGDACRYQVLMKVPIPDTRGAVMTARAREDKEYSDYLTMQQLIQTCGRGTRSETDWCENFITDDSIEWWWRKNRGMAPGWWGGVVREGEIPKAREL